MKKNMTKLPVLYTQFFKIQICQHLDHKSAHLNGDTYKNSRLPNLLFLCTMTTDKTGPCL